MSQDHTHHIPSRSGIVREGSGGGAWRFAEGKILRGREGQTEERADIYGRLMRVGIHSGTVTDTGRPYMQLEADIEGEDGQTIRCKSALLNDDFEVVSSTATNGLAWALLQFDKGDLIMLDAEQSKPFLNPKGKEVRATYVNAYRVKEENGAVKASRLFPPKADKGGPRRTTRDKWAELEPQIRRHPAFAERPARDDDGAEYGGAHPTHLSELAAECAAKGWPSPQQAPAEWLSMLAAAFGEAPRASLAAYDDDTWGQVRQLLAQQTEMPAALQPALQRIQPAAPAPAPAVNRNAFGAAG